MMADLRANPPREIQGSPVIEVLDYQSLTGTHPVTGASRKLDFPKSNVLQFVTADGTKVSARPSGTEPKIKFYFSVQAPMPEKSMYDQVYAYLGKKIDGIIAEMDLK